MQIKAYRANQTQKHGGKMFYVGDIIPAEYMPPFAAQKLLSMGVISETVMETETGTEICSIPILKDDVYKSVEVAKENLDFALKALQNNGNETIEMIKESDNIEGLHILFALETRKSVIPVIEKRLKALGGE